MKAIKFRCLILAALFVSAASPAFALSLATGYDLYSTTSYSFIAFDPDGPGGLDPIPVEVRGEPLHTGLYNTDMIIQRKAGSDPFNVGDEITIPIEIVALSLHSVQPVEIDNTLYDVLFLSGSLLADPLSPLFKQDTVPTNPDGTSTIKKTFLGGGTFDSFFDVFFEIQLTDINDPDEAEKKYQQYKLFIEQAPWVETPGHSYPSIPDYPSGNFYGQFALAEGEGIRLSLVPASTPEPASLVLMAGGLVGIFWMRRKRGVKMLNLQASND